MNQRAPTDRRDAARDLRAMSRLNAWKVRSSGKPPHRRERVRDEAVALDRRRQRVGVQAPAHADRHARAHQELPDRRVLAIHCRQILAEGEDSVALAGHAAVQRGPGDPGREVRLILGEGAEPAHHGQEARQVRRRLPHRELIEHAPRHLVELVEDDFATHDWGPAWPGGYARYLGSRNLDNFDQVQA
jgi:hypothetical protein